MGVMSDSPLLPEAIQEAESLQKETESVGTALIDAFGNLNKEVSHLSKSFAEGVDLFEGINNSLTEGISRSSGQAENLQNLLRRSLDAINKIQKRGQLSPDDSAEEVLALSLGNATDECGRLEYNLGEALKVTSDTQKIAKEMKERFLNEQQSHLAQSPHFQEMMEIVRGPSPKLTKGMGERARVRPRQLKGQEGRPSDTSNISPRGTLSLA